MNTQVRHPRPGLPRRADDAIPRGTVPVDRTPRVPPNGSNLPVRPRTTPSGVTVTPPNTGVPRSATREEATPRDAANAVLGSEYERVDLPGRFVTTTWQDMSMRLLLPMDHAKLTRAVRHENLSLLMDIISSTANRDARELNVVDFYACCRWHRHHSYPATAISVTWSSRYGGRPSERITKTRLEVKELTETRETYLTWKERGLAIPTMRDLELMGTLEPESDAYTLFERAQFIDLDPLADRVRELRLAGDTSPTVTARIEELNKRGLGFFQTVDEFSALFADFGITEHATVTNAGWNPQTAVAALRESGIPDRVEEANIIESMLMAGETPIPRSEEVPLAFSLWTLFPYV